MSAEKYPNIIFTEGVLSGSPRIDGRRLSVGDVVSQLKYSEKIEEVEEDYELTKNEIKQALEYCANQKCLQDKPFKYCHNCQLRTEQDEALDLSLYEEVEVDGEIYVKGDDSMFLGTLSEFIEEWNGTEWWKESLDLLAKYGTGLTEEYKKR